MLLSIAVEDVSDGALEATPIQILSWVGQNRNLSLSPEGNCADGHR